MNRKDMKVGKNIARQLTNRLVHGQHKLVLAESCTAGMAAALLGQIAGVSKVFCGSWVTYREATKRQWLGVEQELIERHTAESIAVSRRMATQVLKKTPDADFAAAITGHLGPQAPIDDGQIFIVVVGRKPAADYSAQHLLIATERHDRQLEAADRLLSEIDSCIKSWTG